MTFQEWVDKNGGQTAVARNFGFTPSLIGAWYRYERFPRAENMTALTGLSDGEIDMQEWARSYADHRKAAVNAGGTATRRLKGNLLVNDLTRLKSVFREMDVDGARCNLRGPGIIARWRRTNVTVSEVRAAMVHLAERGRDGGDVELIHKEINNARRAALGRLEE